MSELTRSLLVQQARWDDLMVPPASQDICISCITLHSCPPEQRAALVADVDRVLKPLGRVVRYTRSLAHSLDRSRLTNALPRS